MSLRSDQRGQAIQVGAVLLFAVLIVAFSTYQAVVVPADNRRVEFNHNQEVQDQMAELRSAMLGTASTTSTRAVTVPLGTTYPSRALGLNPNAPGGSLRTVGTTDPMVNLTIDNAEASGETHDFWNGTVRSYNTGSIEYSPIYNGYDEAPTTVYEHSLLYNRFPDSNALVLGNQTLVDDGRLSIVTVNGSIDRTSSRSTTVDVRPVSSGGDDITIQPADGDPIQLRFSSHLSVNDWRERLGHAGNVSVSEGDFSPPKGLTPIRVDLERPSYRLGMTKAAIGQGATGTERAYLTDVSGAGAPLPLDSTRKLTLEVRDSFNNPVSGVGVSGGIGENVPGTLSPSEAISDADGEVTFTYEVSENAETGTYPVNFTFEDGAVLTDSFNESTPANVTTTVTVGGDSGENGSAGEYSVDWTDPDDESANDEETLVACDPDSCTWDVDASGDGQLVLNATLEPAFEGIDLEFALSNGTVAELADGQGSTGPNGAATATLMAQANGTLNVLASGNEGGDMIAMEIVNASSSDTNPPPEPPTTENGIRYDGNLGTTQSDSGIQFDITNVGSSFARVNGVNIQGQGGDIEYLYNADGNEIEVIGGQNDGNAADQGRPDDAYPTDNSSISFVSNAVLTESGAQSSATVRVRDFGSRPNPNANRYTEYDFTGLQRVSGSESWDVALTLQFQGREDVVYFFQEV